MLKNENRYKKSLENQGWLVDRNGWPDFFASRNGQEIVIEIKDTGRLSAAQLTRLRWFAKVGVKAFLLSKHEAFEILQDGSRIPIDANALFGLILQLHALEFPRSKFVESGRRGGLANKHQNRGGNARARKLSAKRRKEIARLGGLARARMDTA